MNEEYCLIITTFNDDRNGQQIIEALLAEHLAACIQVMPIQSWYHWQGKVHCDAEKLVLIKTKQSLYAQVQETIRSHHAYEVPEIIQVPITDGLPAYLSWIAKECAEMK
jgi:periplasmic divalent cation tolerance protein